MKKLMGICLILILPVIVFAEESILLVKIKGMTCPSCAASVEREVTKLDGVGSVKISIADGSARIRVKEGVLIKDAVIDDAIKKAGFVVESISARPQ